MIPGPKMSNKENNNKWIYDIIPTKQIEEMETKAENLEHNLMNGINVLLSASNDSAIRLCRSYALSKNGNIEHWLEIQEFLNTLIETIEEHLIRENINPYDE